MFIHHDPINVKALNNYNLKELIRIINDSARNKRTLHLTKKMNTTI